MARSTLFEALTGYAEPAGAGGGVPELLSADPSSALELLSASTPAATETRESQFPAVLAALQQEMRDRPEETTNKLADAFGIERDPAAVRAWLDGAQRIVDESRQADLLSGPGGAEIDYEEKYGAPAPASAGPALLGGPDEFSGAYFAQHVVERYRQPPLDLKPKSTTFQDDNVLGLLGWFVFNGPGAIKVPRDLLPPFAEHFGRIAGAAQFVRHDAGDQFVHTLQAGAGGRTRIALFADFGTGLSHAQVIARQIAVDRYDAAVHLGDVYYTGTTNQYEEYFGSLLRPALANGTKLFVIPDNHDGYSGFHAYLAYLRSELPHQRGSYFAIETPHVQFIGIDTIWHSARGRITDAGVLAWLKDRIKAGRDAKRANVLLTGFGPYDVGKNDIFDLHADVAAVAQGNVDMWFWGNTHYCALFDRSPQTSFYGSCIGHAGYPYKRYKRADADGSAAPVLFLETGARYEGTNVRTDRGMNGFCAFEIESDGTVLLRYLDWRGHERCTARFAKQANGGLQLSGGVTDLVN